MTDKELRKLTRDRLLELLLEQTREVDKLKAELDELRKKLEDKNIVLSEAGSIAEAALNINKVFEVAQEAANQYLLSVMNMSERQEVICADLVEQSKARAKELEEATLRKCAAMEEETKRKCDQMLYSKEAQNNNCCDGDFGKPALCDEEKNDLQELTMQDPTKTDLQVNANEQTPDKNKTKKKKNRRKFRRKRSDTAQSV